MSTPRVLHLIDHNGLGGAQRLVAGILKKYPQQAVIPLRIKQPGLFAPAAWQRDAFWRTTFLSNLAAIGQIRYFLEKQKVEILHCHLQASWMTGLTLRAFCERKGIALLFHEHNPYVFHSSVYRRLVKLAGKAGKIIAVSEHIRQRLMACGVPAEQVYLLHNFVDPQDFAMPSSTTADSFFAKGENRILGFSGRLVKEKGWIYALQVLEALGDIPLELWIAGRGKEENKAHHWVKVHGLAERVRFLGFVQEMGAFYRALDLLIHPALEEPFGLAPLEAQACGVAVVSFQFQGSAELFGENSAWLCPPADIDALVDAIRSILGDENLRRDLISRGYINIRRFSPTNFYIGLERIYRDVLG